MSERPDPQASELAATVRIINPDGTTRDLGPGTPGTHKKGWTGSNAICVGDGKPKSRKNK